MSIKGIDTQVMAHRVTEYVKDASAQLRRSEVNQDFLAHQNRALAELAKGQVAHLEQKEPAVINLLERQPDTTPRQKKKRKPSQEEEEHIVIDSDSIDFEPDNPTAGVAVAARLDIEV